MIKKLICILFGHKWKAFGLGNRLCLRCEKYIDYNVWKQSDYNKLKDCH